MGGWRYWLRPGAHSVQMHALLLRQFMHNSIFKRAETRNYKKFLKQHYLCWDMLCEMLQCCGIPLCLSASASIQPSLNLLDLIFKARTCCNTHIILGERSHLINQWPNGCEKDVIV